MKPKLKVYFDFEAFSDQARGGISRYVIELATRLADEIDLTVHAGFHRSKVLREHPSAKVLGRYVAPLKFTGELRRRVNAALARRVIRRFQPDIVHRTYYRHAGPYPGLHRQILTLYDLTYFRFPEDFSGGERVRRNMSRAVRQSDGLICISTCTLDDARSTFKALPQRHRVIPLGVDPAARSRYEPILKTPYFLFVGQRGGYKDFGTLLESLGWDPALERWTLLAIGGGPFDSSERRQISKSGLSGRVVQRSGDDRTLVAAYQHATALVYPSRYEGFGLPLLEAMAHGCPVVCSDAPALLETGDDAALNFSVGDSQELSRVLRTIVEDEAQRTELIRRGRRRAAEFTWDRCAETTLQFYHEVTGQGTIR